MTTTTQDQLRADYQRLADGDDEPISNMIVPALVEIADFDQFDFVRQDLEHYLLIDPASRFVSCYHCYPQGGRPVAVAMGREIMIKIGCLDGAEVARRLKRPSVQLALAIDCDRYKGDRVNERGNLCGVWRCYPGCDDPNGYTCQCALEIDAVIEGVLGSVAQVFDLSGLVDMYCAGDRHLAPELADIIASAGGDSEKIEIVCDLWRTNDANRHDMVHGVKVEDHAIELITEWVEDHCDDDESADDLEICRRALLALGVSQQEVDHAFDI